MIDGHTQLVGLIGWPVEHSLSPAMHNAAFEALGLNWCYLPLPVAAGQVETAVRGLAALGFRGANVTVPHKRAVMPPLQVIAPAARALGAVNTLLVDRDEEGAPAVRGTNTDTRGFIDALRQGGFEPTGRRALVLGAGGAARAVVYGLLEAGVATVDVLNRTPQRAEALVADLASALQAGEKLRPGLLAPDRLVVLAREADLLVNATPVGMWPAVERSIWPPEIDLPATLVVFDLVYNPLETRLLRQARQSGAQPMDGLAMLVGQGALAFELWTGQRAPLDVMRAACEQGLQKGSS